MSLKSSWLGDVYWIGALKRRYYGYFYISSGLYRAQGPSFKAAAEPTNRTFAWLVNCYHHHPHLKNGDKGSKGSSRVVVEVDWIVEYMENLLGLISPEKQGCYEEIRLARLCKSNTPPKRNPDHIPTAKPSTPHLILPAVPIGNQVHMHIPCRPSYSVRAADLLLVNLKRISICHVKLI
jgi:hypothetical protein